MGLNRTYSKPPYERLMIKLKQVQACCYASVPCLWLMAMMLRVADDDDVAGQHVRAAGAADQHVSASGCRALRVTGGCRLRNIISTDNTSITDVPSVEQGVMVQHQHAHNTIICIPLCA